jgi:hypothetical protein
MGCTLTRPDVEFLFCRIRRGRAQFPSFEPGLLEITGK